MLQLKCRCLQQKGRNVTETKLKMPPNCWNYKLKKHEFYVNTRKPIASQSSRAKRIRRRRWKFNQQSHRMKKKETIELLQRQYSPESLSSDEGHQQSSYGHTPSTSKSSPLASSHNKQSLNYLSTPPDCQILTFWLECCTETVIRIYYKIVCFIFISRRKWPVLFFSNNATPRRMKSINRKLTA